MNESKFVAIPRNLLKAREKSLVPVAIDFPSHWLINWREIFKPITKRSLSNCNRVIIFDSHLKTALTTRLRKFSRSTKGLTVNLFVGLIDTSCFLWGR